MIAWLEPSPVQAMPLAFSKRGLVASSGKLSNERETAGNAGNGDTCIYPLIERLIIGNMQASPYSRISPYSQQTHVGTERTPHSNRDGRWYKAT